MPKDQAYHEAAIRYNEGLAEFAETLAPTLGHEEIRRWCTAVGNQHRFHAKRHQSALSKIVSKQTPEEVEQVVDGLDVPDPDVETPKIIKPVESGLGDGCGEFHNPTNPGCMFNPNKAATNA